MLNEEQYKKLFDNISAMLFVQNAEPVLHPEEWYITFTAKDDLSYHKLSKFIKSEAVLVFGEDGEKYVRIRRCQEKCTINFVH